MSNSIERVEQWGEVLAELSNALEKSQNELAENEATKIPKCFEKLEKLAESVTPEKIQKLISPCINRKHLNRTERIVVLSHVINTNGLNSSEMLRLGFGSQVSRFDKLVELSDWGFLPLVELLGCATSCAGGILSISTASPVGLPLLFGGFHLALGFHLRRLNYRSHVRDYKSGLDTGFRIYQFQDINVTALRLVFQELSLFGLEPCIQIGRDGYMLRVTLTIKYSESFLP